MKKWKTGLCWVLMLVLLCGNASAAVNLKKGSLSWDVLFAEERLSQLGYNPGAADGAYDADTVDAVKAFQKDRGLKETGAVKDDTWNALFDETYKLEYNAGIGQRDYEIRGKMPARFAKVEIKGSKSGRQDQADFSDLPGTSSTRVMLMVRDEPMDEIVAACQNYVRETFDKQFTAQYSGQNFKQGKVKTSQINGKPVQMWQTTWNFSNGGKLTRYWYYGVMELDPVGEHQAYLTANLAYNLDDNTKSMDKALGQKVIQETLENVRCDRDRLYEYQAGAAKRLKASKLKKFTLPEFMPVDETEQSTLDIIYEIWHYVDPAADGTQGEMTGETCVSMYYGAKIMNWFMYYVNRGNSREDCRMESVMSLGNSAFYDDFRAARPEIRDKLAAAMSAAKLALNEENGAYLTLLGLEKPEWTAEELDIMTRSLVGVMDSWIEKEKQPAESAEAAGDNSSLRFDGLYRYKYDDTLSYWLAFFEDGKVIEAVAPNNYEGDYIIRKWMDINGATGTYTIDGNQIKFDCESPQGVVSYSGTIRDSSTMVLDTVSHINGFTAEGLVFTFVP